MDLDYFFREISRNEDRYLQSLEQICRKYSAIKEDSIIVDLETMTCQTPDGILPWDGEVVYSKELKRKKLHDKQKKCKDCPPGETKEGSVAGFCQPASASGKHVAEKLKDAVNDEEMMGNDSRYSETEQDSADGHSLQDFQDEETTVHDCDIKILEDTTDNSNFLQDLHSDEEKTVNEDDSMSSETEHDCVASNQEHCSVETAGDDCMILEASQNPADNETLQGPSGVGGVLSMDVGKQYRVDVDILMQDEEDLPGYVLVDWVQKSQQSPNNFENSMGYHGERNKENASFVVTPVKAPNRLKPLEETFDVTNVSGLESSNSSSDSFLADLYPGMVAKMQNVIKRELRAHAATNVLKHYRKNSWYSNSKSSFSKGVIRRKKSKSKHSETVILLKADHASSSEGIDIVQSPNQLDKGSPYRTTIVSSNSSVSSLGGHFRPRDSCLTSSSAVFETSPHVVFAGSLGHKSLSETKIASTPRTPLRESIKACSVGHEPLCETLNDSSYQTLPRGSPYVTNPSSLSSKPPRGDSSEATASPFRHEMARRSLLSAMSSSVAVTPTRGRSYEAFTVESPRRELLSVKSSMTIKPIMRRLCEHIHSSLVPGLLNETMIISPKEKMYNASESLVQLESPRRCVSAMPSSLVVTPTRARSFETTSRRALLSAKPSSPAISPSIERVMQCSVGNELLGCEPLSVAVNPARERLCVASQTANSAAMENVVLRPKGACRLLRRSHSYSGLSQKNSGVNEEFESLYQRLCSPKGSNSLLKEAGRNERISFSPSFRAVKRPSSCYPCEAFTRMKRVCGEFEAVSSMKTLPQNGSYHMQQNNSPKSSPIRSNTGSILRPRVASAWDAMKYRSSLRKTHSYSSLQHAELQTSPLKITQIPENYTSVVGGGHKQSPLKVIHGKDGIIFVKLQNPVSPMIPSSKLF
ncbi:uncharacterized protein LOC121320396 [Polyodon spathula]|uniref:uncharacterized protein LOC121320396 n=1 Tax=Polyodon spathula TaxID=7913 RepID=UPI001B7E4E4F|nr:uncharacterized protein LOC121320396 [Polyodon spathula]